MFDYIELDFEDSYTKLYNSVSLIAAFPKRLSPADNLPVEDTTKCVSFTKESKDSKLRAQSTFTKESKDSKLRAQSTFTKESKDSKLRAQSTFTRQGVIITKQQGDGSVPLVRSTTSYDKPARYFNPIHDELVDNIQKNFRHPVKFNNGMVELYTTEYRKMRYHSDQAQDLADDSYIALFSCYNNGIFASNLRTLQIKEKSTGLTKNITLAHNSVVLFSTKTNGEYLHKIILVGPIKRPITIRACVTDDVWLGVTLRLSKTFVTYKDGVPWINIERIVTRPYQVTNFTTIQERLKLATEEERKLILAERRKENDSYTLVHADQIIRLFKPNETYDNLTLSPGDLLQPE